jgi:hypothetical protein
VGWREEALGDVLSGKLQSVSPALSSAFVLAQLFATSLDPKWSGLTQRNPVSMQNPSFQQMAFTKKPGFWVRRA